MSNYYAVAAKCRAMYGLRITREDYQRIAGMGSVSEVAAFLKQHPSYADTLSHVSAETLSTPAGLEGEISRDLTNDYFRILSFIGRADMPIMRYLVMYMELREIMRFMVAAEAGKPQDYKFDMPKFFDRYSKIRYSQFADISDYSGLLDALRETPYYSVLSQLELRPSGWPDYSTVETAIRSSYFRWVMSTIKKHYSGNVQQSLKETIGVEADMRNITALIRLRRSFPKALDIAAAYLLPVFYRLTPVLVRQLTSANDEEGMLSALRAQTGFERLFPAEPYDDAERYFYEAMTVYYRRLLRAGTPHVGTPMAYLHLKELEIRNLITLVECVRYQIPADKAMTYLYN